MSYCCDRRVGQGVTIGSMTVRVEDIITPIVYLSFNDLCRKMTETDVIEGEGWSLRVKKIRGRTRCWFVIDALREIPIRRIP